MDLKEVAIRYPNISNIFSIIFLNVQKILNDLKKEKKTKSQTKDGFKRDSSKENNIISIALSTKIEDRKKNEATSNYQISKE